MSRIQLENVKKVFGKVTALDGVSLDIKDKEFFVLFGPAGAGKTTILNTIAGIQIPEEGVVKFDGEIVNLVDAAHRDTAMVFENYALYPDMTIYLDVDEEIGLSRLSDRAFKDRLDQESIEFHHRVSEGYREVLKRFKDRITIIDASKSKEEVIDASMKEILKLINDQRTA